MKVLKETNDQTIETLMTRIDNYGTTLFKMNTFQTLMKTTELPMNSHQDHGNFENHGTH